MRRGTGTCSECDDLPIYAEHLCVFCWSKRKGWNAALDTLEQQVRSHYKTTPPLSVQRILKTMEELRVNPNDL